MTSPLGRAAVSLPLLWTQIYTAGLPEAVREPRRLEIASDVYEQCTAEGPETPVLELIVAVAAGVPDDLRWRASHMTLTGSFVQAAAAASPVAAIAGWLSFHITGQAAISLALALAIEAVLLALLLALTHMEVTMTANERGSAVEAPRIDTMLTFAALLLYGSLVLAAMLIIPMAGDDPAGDERDLAERAAQTGRWVAGYSVYALGIGLGMLGIAGLGGMVRRHGALALGTVAPALFAVGAIAIIAGGHGHVGLALAAVVDTGLDGEAFLQSDVGQAGIVYSWLGGLTCGLALLTLAAGVWRGGLLSGWVRIAAVGAIGVQAIAMGLFTGHGVGPATLAYPIAALVAYGLLTWHVLWPRTDQLGVPVGSAVPR